MKSLITGGLGFIGSNFIRHILTRHSEYEIVNIDKIGMGANPKNLSDLEKGRNTASSRAIYQIPNLSKKL